MLSDDDLERYARQAIMPAIGEEGLPRQLQALSPDGHSVLDHHRSA